MYFSTAAGFEPARQCANGFQVKTAISPCPNHHIYIHTIAPYVLVCVTHIMKYVGQGLSPRKHPSYEHVFFDESSVHFSSSKSPY